MRKKNPSAVRSLPVGGSPPMARGVLGDIVGLAGDLLPLWLEFEKLPPADRGFGEQTVGLAARATDIMVKRGVTLEEISAILKSQVARTLFIAVLRRKS